MLDMLIQKIVDFILGLFGINTRHEENKDKNINIDKIYEKGYSTKPHNTGSGLWEVENILKKHKNITRFTTKDDQLFKQQIEIYKN